MKRGTLTLLSVFLLIAVFGFSNMAAEQAFASSENSDNCEVPEFGGRGLPPGLGGDDGDVGPGSSLDAGDDDDTWDCIQSGDEPGDDDASVSQLMMVLESWWWTSSGLTL
jgi:hypothetical protein